MKVCEDSKRGSFFFFIRVRALFSASRVLLCYGGMNEDGMNHSHDVVMSSFRLARVGVGCSLFISINVKQHQTHHPTTYYLSFLASSFTCICTLYHFRRKIVSDRSNNGTFQETQCGCICAALFLKHIPRLFDL